MVVVTEYFGPVLHAEQVFRAIEDLGICFRDLVSFILIFCYKSGTHLVKSSDIVPTSSFAKARKITD